MADKLDAVDDQTAAHQRPLRPMDDVRNIVESYANDYFLKAPLKQGTAQDMVQDGLVFTSKLARPLAEGHCHRSKGGRPHGRRGREGGSPRSPDRQAR